MDMHVVRQLANTSRTWAEKYARAEESKGSLYIDGFTLCGMCAIASAHLYTALMDAGIPVTLWTNNLHCFLTVGDYIVDITATQFGTQYEPVTIRLITGATRGWWAQDVEHDSVVDLRRHQKVVGWVDTQIVPKTLLPERRRNMLAR